ncbi:hypothetical protein SNOG_06871 [Parastagonospora nodorum SN15]|uniref:Uncharacterized protein n=1 Tax=Phaeosphaeria nodorum (strain SN15 / ATCC MYA-4574 / FGSC 10173) TaxID=321614 RepID=Q0UMZ3_PHANO|nr:hypothetical protein SNOG_06871 [Parastagonospora nodorum SN15]EAT85522.1 hypothetical protein SNOG_06871 [Parastagonospora nodorum SN15]
MANSAMILRNTFGSRAAAQSYIHKRHSRRRTEEVGGRVPRRSHPPPFPRDTSHYSAAIPQAPWLRLHPLQSSAAIGGKAANQLRNHAWAQRPAVRPARIVPLSEDLDKTHKTNSTRLVTVPAMHTSRRHTPTHAFSFATPQPEANSPFLTPPGVAHANRD